MTKTFKWTLEEFLAIAKDKTYDTLGGRGSWFGNITHEEALSKAQNGDDSYVPNAEKLIDKLEHIESGEDIKRYSESPMGAYVSVPDYLAGSPMPMRLMMDTGEKSPINIFVSTTSSATINAETMRKRGEAILALVLVLQRTRPIELHLIAELGSRDMGMFGSPGDHFQVITLPSRPLSISQSAFVLCHVGFARHLTYGVAKALDGFTGQWPNSYQRSDYPEIRAKAIGLGPNDLLIKEAHAHDLMISDPIKWINQQVSKFNESEGE